MAYTTVSLLACQGERVGLHHSEPVGLPRGTQGHTISWVNTVSTFKVSYKEVSMGFEKAPKGFHGFLRRFPKVSMAF